MKRVLISVGTRPNFIKVTRFRELAKQHGKVDVKIVHTGQHYDRFMSSVFFEQFNIQPDYFLALESRNPASQMGEMITKLADLISNTKPDLVITPGDVNSTLAAAIACNKTGTPVAHLESGLRSFDRSMPEEINRLLVDEVADLCFVTEQSGMDNLEKEGKRLEKAHFVGNTMIDTLVAFEQEIEDSPILKDHDLTKGQYALMTMHRPATVDRPEGIDFIKEVIEGVTQDRKLVFPLHPRTKARLEEFGKWDEFTAMEGLIITKPLGYFAFQKLIKYAAVILTDSGGIQEESTFRRVPCLTLRSSTERPVTITLGSNELVPLDAPTIIAKSREIGERRGEIPPLWDGHSTERVLEAVYDYLDVAVSKAKA